MSRSGGQKAIATPGSALGQNCPAAQLFMLFEQMSGQTLMIQIVT
jgi:hypothetical protein